MKVGKNNIFIALEGIDGVGKTTLVKSLSKIAINEGINCLTGCLPYDCDAAQTFNIREYNEELEHAETDQRDNKSFFIANAIACYANQLRKWRAKDDTLILFDRHLLSTFAYNATDRNEMEAIWNMTNHLSYPDLIFYLSSPIKDCVETILLREKSDRMPDVGDLWRGLENVRFNYDNAISFLANKKVRIERKYVRRDLANPHKTDVLFVGLELWQAIEEAFPILTKNARTLPEKS